MILFLQYQFLCALCFVFVLFVLALYATFFPDATDRFLWINLFPSSAASLHFIADRSVDFLSRFLIDFIFIIGRNGRWSAKRKKSVDIN
jgi:hypothetical protein